MDLQAHLCCTLQVAPEAVVGWLHALINRFIVEVEWPNILVMGPHTFVAAAPAPFETLALYVVENRKVHDVAARQVVLALTYLPLRQPGIGLDLRVWPLFPAALEPLHVHFSDFFTQASPVISSAADLHFISDLTILACNRWLLNHLATPAYADNKVAKQLYPAWLEQYRALKGSYPADPRRAFRGLIAQARRRG